MGREITSAQDILADIAVSSLNEGYWASRARVGALLTHLERSKHGRSEYLGVVLTRKVEPVHLLLIPPLVEGLRRLVVLQPLQYGTIDHNLKFEDDIINEADIIAFHGSEPFVSSAPSPDKSYVRAGMWDATLLMSRKIENPGQNPKAVGRVYRDDKSR